MFYFDTNFNETNRVAKIVQLATVTALTIHAIALLIHVNFERSLLANRFISLPLLKVESCFTCSVNET